MRQLVPAGLLVFLVACGTIVKERSYVAPPPGRTIPLTFISKGSAVQVVIYEDARDCRNRFVGPFVGGGETVTMPAEHGVAFQLRWVDRVANKECKIQASFEPEQGHSYTVVWSQDKDTCSIVIVDDSRGEKGLRAVPYALRELASPWDETGAFCAPLKQ